MTDFLLIFYRVMPPPIEVTVRIQRRGSCEVKQPDAWKIFRLFLSINETNLWKQGIALKASLGENYFIWKHGAMHAPYIARLIYMWRSVSR